MSYFKLAEHVMLGRFEIKSLITLELDAIFVIGVIRNIIVNSL